MAYGLTNAGGGVSGGGGGKKYASKVVGHVNAGYTANDVDYLCTGTDDDTIITAAIEALPAEGGKVLLLEGDYTLSSQLVIEKDNVTLEGMGNGTKIGGHTISIRGNYCKFTGFCSHDTVYLYDASYCTVTGNIFDGGYSLYVHGDSYNNIITDNICNAPSHGIFISKSTGSIIMGNTISNSSYGMYLSTAYKNVITGNTINNASRGIYILGAIADNTITGNTINSSSSTGIYFYGANSINNTITGNTINSSGSYGMYIYNTKNTDNTITGNTINSSGSYGIYLRGGESAITGNTVNNNGDYGININSGSNYAVVGNTVTGNAININGSGTDSVITHNTTD